MAYDPEVEQSLLALLKGLSAVTNLVGSGSNARIRTDRFHARDSYPAILIEVDREEDQNDLGGSGGLVIADVTLTCRAQTRKASRELARAVKLNGTTPGTGLAGYHGTPAAQTIDVIWDEEVCTWTRKRDGSDEGWYDVLCSLTVIYQHAV